MFLIADIWKSASPRSVKISRLLGAFLVQLMRRYTLRDQPKLPGRIII